MDAAPSLHSLYHPGRSTQNGSLITAMFFVCFLVSYSYCIDKLTRAISGVGRSLKVGGQTESSMVIMTGERCPSPSQLGEYCKLPHWGLGLCLQWRTQDLKKGGGGGGL